MKRFQCVVLDKKWQTRSGTLEADDTDHARQKVFEMGFSIVQIKEIPIDDSTPPDSLIHPEHKPENPPPANQAAGPQSPAPEEPGAENTKNVKKRPGVLMPLIIVILIAAVNGYFLYSYSQRQGAKQGPAEVVSDYIAYGRSNEWEKQFTLLAGFRMKHYSSPDQYVSAREKKWLGYTPVFSEDSESADYARIALGGTEVISKTPAEARVRAGLIENNMKKKFLFILHPEVNRWKIAFIRDEYQAALYLKFLARNPPEAQRKKLKDTLTSLYGYREEEINAGLREEVLRAEAEELERELARETRKNAAPASPSVKEAAVVETPETDEFQDQMETLIAQMDNLEE